MTHPIMITYKDQPSILIGAYKTTGSCFGLLCDRMKLIIKMNSSGTDSSNSVCQ